MGRPGSTIHSWTPEEEDRLLLTIEECQPLLDHYFRQGYPKTRWWDTVAGRMAPSPLVTGAACARRYQLLLEQNKVHKADQDNWVKVAEMVENYEQELQEAMYDRIVALETKAQVLQTMVERLCEAWDVKTDE